MRWLATLLFLLGLGVPAMAQPMTAPDDIAKQWLLLIDDGDYAKAWDQAGTILKSQISADAFEKKVAPVRGPLGAVASRTIKDVKLSKTMPGMADGQYAVVRFDSAFAHKTAAVETIALVMENGAWTVVGYHID